MTRTIYDRMGSVMRDIGAISKDQTNTFHKYQFRGIDDVMNHLHGPLAAHGVFILPEVLEALYEWKTDAKGKPMRVATLRVAFHFVGPDGDRVTAVGQGEANANDDKASNKAMAAAMKYVLLYTFCIPTSDMGDADQSSPDLGDPDLMPGDLWDDLRTRGTAMASAAGEEAEEVKRNLLDRFGIDKLTRGTPEVQARALLGGLNEWLEANSEPWEPVSGDLTGEGDATPGAADEARTEPDRAADGFPPGLVEHLAGMRKAKLIAEAHLRELPAGGTVEQLRRIVGEAIMAEGWSEETADA